MLRERGKGRKAWIGRRRRCRLIRRGKGASCEISGGFGKFKYEGKSKVRDARLKGKSRRPLQIQRQSQKLGCGLLRLLVPRCRRRGAIWLDRLCLFWRLRRGFAVGLNLR